jgi:S1-C subfamily serine protease
VAASARQNPRYIAALALSSCGLLLAGWWARPRDAAQQPASAPTETELAQLARRTERRSLENTSAFFAGLARDADASLVYVRTASATGIAWDATHIVTVPVPGDALASTVFRSQPADIAANPLLWGPQMPLSAFQNRGLPPVRRADVTPAPGDWLVAVWRNDNGEAFSAGNFRQLGSVACGVTPVTEIVSSLALTRDMLGGGLFDMNGDLLGIVLPCRDRLATVAANAIQGLLQHAGTLEQQLLGRYGFGLSDRTQDDEPFFNGAPGVLVREIWVGSTADRAGLWPGDVIVALNGQPVASVADLRPLNVTSDSASTLSARRGKQPMTFTLAPVPAQLRPDSAQGVGLVWESPPKTYRIEAVAPGSRAALAGVLPGDRLVRIDRKALPNLAQVERTLSAGSPPARLLEVEREGRRMAILMP